MNNNSIKNNEMEENIENQLTKVFFDFEESEIIEIKKCPERDWVDEEDEIDDQGYLIKAKNLNIKLIEAHYEVTVVKKNNKEGSCPCCGQITTKVHDYYYRYIQDVTLEGLPVFIKYKIKRFRCPDCAKNFSEENKDFPKGIKKRKRLTFQIMKRLKENCSRATIAREENVSENFVKKVLDVSAFSKKKLGEVICIDEFKGNLRTKINKKWITRKYQTLIKNPVNGEIIDILPSRDKSELEKFFSQISVEERNKVKYYICDMNQYFIKIGKKYFKNAKVIIDRFHYTKAITEAFEKIRKGSQRFLTKEQVKELKKTRCLLLKRIDKLNETEKEIVESILDRNIILKKAYKYLQQFYDINKETSRREAEKALKQFYEEIETYNNMYFKNAVETIKRHEKEILDSFECRYTNAYAEGTNNLIKVIKRVGYGLKNLERFKKRLELIVNNYKEIRMNKQKHKLIRQKNRLKRKQYRKEIKAAIEMAA